MDPDVLRRAMPGCERLDRVADNRFTTVLKAGVGPVKGSFTGEVALSDIVPHRGYTLTTRARSPIGFVEGVGRIALEPSGAETLIQFSGEVKVGGTLASVAGRLIEAAAQKNIRETFANLAREIGAAPTAEPGEAK